VEFLHPAAVKDKASMKIRSFHVRDATAPEIPLVVSIPHCGIYVPEAIRAKFASAYIHSLPLTDWHLHSLCDFLPGMGITTIYGTYSRFVADVDAPPEGASFVTLETPDGSPVYSEPPTPQDIQARRELVYAPYQARLNELLQSRLTRFGNVVLVSLHSFSSQSLSGHHDPVRQVYLGDDMGRANPGWLTGAAQHAFSHAGLTTSRNQPFRGNYSVRHYGALPRISALYMGLRWDLYLDEQQPDRAPTHAGFRAFRSILSDVFTNLTGEINAGSLRMSRSQRVGTNFVI
jgi:N-formylglutamate deformylase